MIWLRKHSNAAKASLWLSTLEIKKCKANVKIDKAPKDTNVRRAGMKDAFSNRFLEFASNMGERSFPMYLRGHQFHCNLLNRRNPIVCMLPAKFIL